MDQNQQNENQSNINNPQDNQGAPSSGYPAINNQQPINDNGTRPMDWPQRDSIYAAKPTGRKNLKKGLIIFFIPLMLLVLAFTTKIIGNTIFGSKSANTKSTGYSSSSSSSSSSEGNNSIVDSLCSGEDNCEEDKEVNNASANGSKDDKTSAIGSVFNIISIIFGMGFVLSFLPCVIVGIVFMAKK